MKINCDSAKKLLNQVSRLHKLTGEITVIVTNAFHIRQLNKRYFGKNEDTDVIAFNLAEDSPRNYLEGEIYVCLPRVRIQADIERVTAEEEFGRVCLHGLLHLIGFDDKKKADKALMWRIQESYLKGIFNGVERKRRTSPKKRQKTSQ